MPTSCVSRRQPFGNSGRSGRSIMRAISVAFSPARPSRLKNEPGILPAAYIRSSTSTVSGMKSMSRRLPAVAVPRTRLSPEATRTAPEACLARRPVSNTISDPPIWTETSCTSAMYSFLDPPLGPWRIPQSLFASVVSASMLAAGLRRSLDGERSLHAGLAVLADGAVVLVGARLEVDGDGGVALGDYVGFLFDAVALDLEGVRHLRRVAEVERHLAGLGGQLGLVELERAVLRRGDLDGLASSSAAGRRLLRRRRRGGGLLVVVSAAAGEDRRREDHCHQSTSHLDSSGGGRVLGLKRAAPARHSRRRHCSSPDSTRFSSGRRTTRIRSYSPSRAAVVSTT